MWAVSAWSHLRVWNLVAVMNSGLLQLPHVLSPAPFTLTSKRLALAVSSFIFLLGPKNRGRKVEEASFLLPFPIFGQGWERNISFNQGREWVTEIFGKIERNRAFSFPFFLSSTQSERDRELRPWLRGKLSFSFFLCWFQTSERKTHNFSCFLWWSWVFFCSFSLFFEKQYFWFCESWLKEKNR